MTFSEEFPTLDEGFAKGALEKFVGCDSNELHAGNPADASVWLFGIEHGTYKSEHDAETAELCIDDSYSISTQRKWPYNQKAFKLLAAVQGYQVGQWEKFAEEAQPFVKGSKGYFKGNLFPYACHDQSDWPPSARAETGTSDKAEYQRWCRNYRLPTIKNWVDEYRPRMFIGVGITCREEFSRAVFGDEVDLHEHELIVNGHKKRLFHLCQNGRKLVVVPHFAGIHGLNSNEALQQAGDFIGKLMRST